MICRKCSTEKPQSGFRPGRLTCKRCSDSGGGARKQRWRDTKRQPFSVSDDVSSPPADTGIDIPIDEDLSEWDEGQKTDPGVPHVYSKYQSSTSEVPIRDELVVPRGTKPSEIPIDHHVTGTAISDGYLISTSDHHYPIHDKICEAAVIRLAQDLPGLHTWVFNGDVVDAWWISRHEKEAERLFDPDAGNRIVDEVAAFRPLALEASRLARTVYLGEGNHEVRLRGLINANPALHGLPGLTWARIHDLPGNVHHLEYGYRLRLGSLSFVHGDRMGGRFGVKHPAAWALDNQGARSVIFGHTHRMESKFRTVWEETGEPRTVVAINQGHLSDVTKQRYVSEPNWQHGLVVVECFTVAGKPRYTPHPIPIVDGRFSFNGKVYDGRNC